MDRDSIKAARDSLTDYFAIGKGDGVMDPTIPLRYTE